MALIKIDILYMPKDKDGCNDFLLVGDMFSMSNFKPWPYDLRRLILCDQVVAKLIKVDGVVMQKFM